MMLHNNKDLFDAIVIEASEKYNIVPVIIEKDYYVTLFLREIAKRNSNIIFKGGTSLSKCFHLINRFSEDIDLSIESDIKLTVGQRRKLVSDIKDIIQYYGFILKNPNDIRSRRDFNHFEVDVHSIFSSEYIKRDLIVETSIFIRSFPTAKMSVSSYIYDYLKLICREDIISEYNLEPFDINVQAAERTFVDKIFAICDYYLDGNIDEHSRHLYDLYKISDIVAINDSLKELFYKVREERKIHKTCLSARDDVDIKTCIQEIIEKDIYKKDYEKITAQLIFDGVEYETVKKFLIIISNSILFN